MTSARARPLPPEQRRSAIIAAATPLVAEHGTLVTTRQIAQAAGIAEGTIFRAFPDKGAVIAGVLDSVMDPEQTVAELAAVEKSAPLADRLRATVDILQRRLDSVFAVVMAIGRTSPRGERDPRPRHNQAHDPIMPVIEAIFAPDAARLRQDPAHAARLLRLLVFSGTHPLISDGQRLSAAEIVDVLLHGILDDKGPPGRRRRP